MKEMRLIHVINADQADYIENAPYTIINEIFLLLLTRDFSPSNSNPFTL